MAHAAPASGAAHAAAAADAAHANAALDVSPADAGSAAAYAGAASDIDGADADAPNFASDIEPPLPPPNDSLAKTAVYHVTPADAAHAFGPGGVVIVCFLRT